MFLKAKGRCPFAGECMFGNSMGGTQLPSLLASKGSYSPLPAATGLGLFPTLLLVPSDMYDAHDLAPTCAVPPPYGLSCVLSNLQPDAASWNAKEVQAWLKTKGLTQYKKQLANVAGQVRRLLAGHHTEGSQNFVKLSKITLGFGLRGGPGEAPTPHPTSALAVCNRRSYWHTMLPTHQHCRRLSTHWRSLFPTRMRRQGQHRRTPQPLS